MDRGSRRRPVRRGSLLKALLFFSLGSLGEREKARPIRVQHRLRELDLAWGKTAVVGLAPAVLHLLRREADASYPSSRLHRGAHLRRIIAARLLDCPFDHFPLVIARPATAARLLAVLPQNFLLMRAVLLDHGSLSL